MAKKKQPNIGGKPKGMNKEVLDARRIIRTQGELEYKISQDVIDAYNVIRNVLADESAPAASRRAAANDIIKMFEALQEKSEKIVEEFEENREDRQTEGSQGNSENITPMFKFADE